MPKYTPDSIREAVTDIAGANPATKAGRGDLLAISAMDEFYPESLRRIARERLEETPDPGLPDRDRYVPPFDPDSRGFLGSEFMRALTPEELALVQLMGGRRDDLTDTEAAKLWNLLQATEEGPGRDLIEYVIEPARDRIRRAIATEKATDARQRLDRLPTKVPRLSDSHRAALVEALADVAETNVQGLDADAARAAARDIAERAVGEAEQAAVKAHAANRAALEETAASAPAAQTAPDLSAIADVAHREGIAWSRLKAAEDAGAGNVDALRSEWADLYNQRKAMTGGDAA